MSQICEREGDHNDDFLEYVDDDALMHWSAVWMMRTMNKIMKMTRKR